MKYFFLTPSHGNTKKETRGEARLKILPMARSDLVDKR